MPFKQGQLVTLKEPRTLPDGTLEDYHPFLIINSTRSGFESFYTVVMMSATAHKDRFSFPVEDSMFESPLAKKGCQIRMYLIFGINESDIKDLKNVLKKPHLTAIVREITERIFSID